MPLLEVRVANCRIIESAALEFSSSINLVLGMNGSGKTSLLESLHCLAVGRSFLTPRSELLIRSGSEALSVFGRLDADAPAQQLGLGLDRQGNRRCRVDGETQRSMLASAKALPVFVLEPNLQSLVSGGPGERRRYLDRGLFHVEHDYQSIWSAYRKSLRHRNALLKMRRPGRELGPWNQEVSTIGEQLDQKRLEYLERLKEVLHKLLPKAGFEGEVSLQYRRGWKDGVTLSDALVAHLAQDQQTGTTGVGPHRADLQIRVESVEARQRLSRGQTKRLVSALVFAQVFDYVEQTGRVPTLLFDDFGSELDADSQSTLFRILMSRPVQVVGNSLDAAALKPVLPADARVFHVEHGRFSLVV